MTSFPKNDVQSACRSIMQSLVYALGENVTEDGWLEFSSLFKRQPYNKGAYFSEAGEYPAEIGFICSGVFRAFYRSSTGTEYNKTFFSAHSFIAPLRSLVTGSANQICLQALTDAEILVARYQSITSLYDHHQSIERFARRIIETEWCEKELRELRLVLNSAEERYEHFLSEHPGLENLIPQYHIASYLGITPVALSRIRNRRSKR